MLKDIVISTVDNPKNCALKSLNSNSKFDDSWAESIEKIEYTQDNNWIYNPWLRVGDGVSFNRFSPWKCFIISMIINIIFINDDNNSTY